METKSIGVRIPVDLLNRLNNLTENTGVTLSRVMVDSLTLVLDKIETIPNAYDFSWKKLLTMIQC